MPGFADASLIAAADQAMDMIFETFKRDQPVRFYKRQTEVYFNDNGQAINLEGDDNHMLQQSSGLFLLEQDETPQSSLSYMSDFDKPRHRTFNDETWNLEQEPSDDDLLMEDNENIITEDAKEPVFGTPIPNYCDFDARIIYLDRIENPTFIGGGLELTTKMRQNYGKVKMQIKASGSGYSWLKDAERFIFNGEKYQIDESWRGIGMFGSINYYSIVLSKVV